MKQIIDKILLTLQEINRYNNETKVAIESLNKKIVQLEERIISLENKSHGDCR
jgi:peptidoglycan hydrolase CwlO-like protein